MREHVVVGLVHTFVHTSIHVPGTEMEKRERETERSEGALARAHGSRDVGGAYWF